MENLETLMKLWKTINNANDQELLAIVSNDHNLDWRSQIFASQRGNEEVLMELFQQKDLCEEAKIYMAKRGTDKVRQKLLKEPKISNSAKKIAAEIGSLKGGAEVQKELLKEQKISNSIQTIIAEIGSLENVKTLISVNKEPLAVQAELNILDREEEFQKTLAVRTNLSSFSHTKIAQEASFDVLKVFLQKNDLQNNFLKEIVRRNEEVVLKRNDSSLPEDELKTIATKNEEELLALVLQQTSLPVDVFLGVISKSTTDNLLLVALKRKDLTIESLDKITQKISPVHYGKILDKKYLLTSAIVSDDENDCEITDHEDPAADTLVSDDPNDSEITDRKDPLTSIFSTIAQNGNHQDISCILEYSFLNKKVQLAIVNNGTEDDAIALLKRDDIHEDTIKKIYTIYENNTRVYETLFSILDLSSEKHSKIVKQLNVEDYDRILAHPNICNSVLKAMVDKCTTAQCEYILSFKNLNAEVLKEIILKKKQNKNIILRVMSEHELNEGIMKAIVQSKNAECISYLLQEDNLPNCVQTAIAKDRTASIKICLDLLQQTNLCDAAQIELAQMNKKDVSVILSARKDLCTTAQIALVKYGISLPKIRNKSDVQDEIARKKVINNLLERESLCNKAQELIATTGNSAYAERLLRMRFVTPETKKLIALYCNCD